MLCVCWIPAFGIDTFSWHSQRPCALQSASADLGLVLEACGLFMAGQELPLRTIVYDAFHALQAVLPGSSGEAPTQETICEITDADIVTLATMLADRYLVHCEGGYVQVWAAKD